MTPESGRSEHYSTRFSTPPKAPQKAVAWHTAGGVQQGETWTASADTDSWQSKTFTDVPVKAGDAEFDWNAKFAPLTTTRLRLLVTAAPGDLIRIWEFEVYRVPDTQ